MLLLLITIFYRINIERMLLGKPRFAIANDRRIAVKNSHNYKMLAILCMLVFVLGEFSCSSTAKFSQTKPKVPNPANVPTAEGEAITAERGAITPEGEAITAEEVATADGVIESEKKTIEQNSKSVPRIPGVIFGVVQYEREAPAALDELPTKPLKGVNLKPEFSDHYTVYDLAKVSGVSGPYGGVALKYDDDAVLLVAGNDGIYEVEVIRDNRSHIIALGNSELTVNTPDRIDGGLYYGPNDVLFAVAYPAGKILQVKPGSDQIDKITDVSMYGTGGSIGFVPKGFPGEGGVKFVVWDQFSDVQGPWHGHWFELSLDADSSGTFAVDEFRDVLGPLQGGVEGFSYVPRGSTGFTESSIIVSEWWAGKIATYDADQSGNPVLSTRKVILNGAAGAEGAFFDQKSGDFVFSCWGGLDRIFSLKGFVPQVYSEPIVSQVFIDKNGNGKWDEGEEKTSVGVDGEYSLPVIDGENFSVVVALDKNWHTDSTIEKWIASYGDGERREIDFHLEVAPK
jgi:hypothetical protein